METTQTTWKRIDQTGSYTLRTDLGVELSLTCEAGDILLFAPQLHKAGLYRDGNLVQTVDLQVA